MLLVLLPLVLLLCPHQHHAIAHSSNPWHRMITPANHSASRERKLWLWGWRHQLDSKGEAEHRVAKPRLPRAFR